MHANQALQAVFFLYREMLQRPIDDELNSPYTKRMDCLPVAHCYPCPEQRDYAVRSPLDETRRLMRAERASTMPAPKLTRYLNTAPSSALVAMRA